MSLLSQIKTLNAAQSPLRSPTGIEESYRSLLATDTFKRSAIKTDYAAMKIVSHICTFIDCNRKRIYFQMDNQIRCFFQDRIETFAEPRMDEKMRDFTLL